jgi:hypothetical protein
MGLTHRTGRTWTPSWYHHHPRVHTDERWLGGRCLEVIADVNETHTNDIVDRLTNPNAEHDHPRTDRACVGLSSFYKGSDGVLRMRSVRNAIHSTRVEALAQQGGNPVHLPTRRVHTYHAYKDASGVLRFRAGHSYHPPGTWVGGDEGDGFGQDRYDCDPPPAALDPANLPDVAQLPYPHPVPVLEWPGNNPGSRLWDWCGVISFPVPWCLGLCLPRQTTAYEQMTDSWWKLTLNVPEERAPGALFDINRWGGRYVVIPFRIIHDPDWQIWMPGLGWTYLGMTWAASLDNGNFPQTGYCQDWLPPWKQPVMNLQAIFGEALQSDPPIFGQHRITLRTSAETIKNPDHSTWSYWRDFSGVPVVCDPTNNGGAGFGLGGGCAPLNPSWDKALMAFGARWIYGIGSHWNPLWFPLDYPEQMRYNWWMVDPDHPAYTPTPIEPNADHCYGFHTATHWPFFCPLPGYPGWHGDPEMGMYPSSSPNDRTFRMRDVFGDDPDVCRGYGSSDQWWQYLKCYGLIGYNAVPTTSPL